jgi:hypothetical protein
MNKNDNQCSETCTSASNSVGNGDSFPGSEAARREADYSNLSWAENRCLISQAQGQLHFLLYSSSAFLASSNSVLTSEIVNV